MKLVLGNGEEAKKGMKVNTFRGEEVELVSWGEPKPGSSGKVTIKRASGLVHELYVDVIGAKFVEGGNK